MCIRDSRHIEVIKHDDQQNVDHGIPAGIVIENTQKLIQQALGVQRHKRLDGTGNRQNRAGKDDRQNAGPVSYTHLFPYIVYSFFLSPHLPESKNRTYSLYAFSHQMSTPFLHSTAVFVCKPF